MNTDTELPVRVYSPEKVLKHPVAMAGDIVRDIAAGRELAWRLFIRDLSAQYRQSYLGYVWAFLPPLAASFTFIFLNRQGIVKIDTGAIPYPAFAMMGTLLWQLFVDAMQCAPAALTSAKPMLAKINFPREAILLGGLYMVGFNFAIRLILLAVVLVIWHVVPGWGLLMFPVAAGALVLAGFTVGLALCPVSGLYGDIGKALPMLTQFWMLLTPVVYPARTTGMAGWIATFNPVAPLITTARECLMGAGFTQLPAFGGVVLISLGACLVGLIGFRIAMPHLIARMG